MRADDSKLRFDLAEASGSLGDLGTFVPLSLSLIVVCGLDAGAVLVLAGLANIVSGWMFRQPIPVQPMKAIAAVAIASALSPGTIAASGIAVGAALLLLAVTGMIERIERAVPRALVRGIQVGVGLKLVLKAADMLRPAPALSLDGWVLATLLAVFFLIASRWPRVPAALLACGAGVAAIFVTHPGLVSELRLGWGGPPVVVPALDEWRTGILQAALPQLPLTLLNSVIAVCVLSGDLFPGRAIPTRKMASSAALMNLIGCWFGAVPACHGAGGLAGQYRFGARTGGSVIMLGAAKVGVGLLLGASAAVLLEVFPVSVLAVLLGFAGVELAMPVATLRRRRDYLVALLTAAGVLSFNTAVGVVIGVVASVLLKSRDENDEA